MKKLIFIAALLFAIPGCGNLSPRNDLTNRIDNTEGEIEKLQNLQNSMNLELGQLRNQTDINARDLRNLQQGFINYNRENSGVQILQGDGPLILVFGVAVVFLILIFHYREKYKEEEKTVDLLAEEIVKYDDVELEDAVFVAAMGKGVEKRVLDAVVKHQKKHGVYHLRHNN